MIRLCTSTCVAARPTPGAAYIVSAMSATSRSISGVKAVTRDATFFSRGSGYSRMFSRAMDDDRGSACKMQVTDAESRVKSLYLRPSLA